MLGCHSEDWTINNCDSHCTHTLPLALFCFLTQMKQVAICDVLRCIDVSTLLRGQCGKKLKVASRQPPVTKALSLTASKELSFASEHKCELESRSFPNWIFRCDHSLGRQLDCTLLETLSPKPRLCHSQISDHRNCETVNIKSLNFRVIFYAGIGN